MCETENNGPISPEELKKLALLAKLEIREEEMNALAAQLGRMVAFADTIRPVPVQPAAGDAPARGTDELRPDEILPSFPRGEILQNAPQTERDSFVVRKRGNVE